jgi:hypothetical protein
MKGRQTEFSMGLKGVNDKAQLLFAQINRHGTVFLRVPELALLAKAPNQRVHAGRRRKAAMVKREFHEWVATRRKPLGLLCSQR